MPRIKLTKRIIDDLAKADINKFYWTTAITTPHLYNCKNINAP